MLRVEKFKMLEDNRSIEEIRIIALRLTALDGALEINSMQVEDEANHHLLSNFRHCVTHQ